MRTIIVVLGLLGLIASFADAFGGLIVIIGRPSRTSTCTCNTAIGTVTRLHSKNQDIEEDDSLFSPSSTSLKRHEETDEEAQWQTPFKALSRRDVLLRGGANGAVTALAITSAAIAAADAAEDEVLASSSSPSSNVKVLVLGGSGFVGSRVVETLHNLGVPVIATSTTGRGRGRRSDDDEFTTTVVALDLTASNAQAQLEKIFSSGGASTSSNKNTKVTAVISCVGTIGTADDEAVNAATGRVAAVAKAAGVERFVYITVAPEVKDLAQDIEFLSGYMKGKMFSRAAVLSQFGDKATLIEPTFIYGGGSFEVNPPRVPGFYGQFIEGLLSASPVRQVERILSPGIIKIALEPPVAVDDVAKAAVAGALGKSPLAILDTYDKIKKAAALIA